jgi:hypothetical protein
MSYFDDYEDDIIFGRSPGRRRNPPRNPNKALVAEPGSELAMARQAAHRAFDPLWLSGRMSHSDAYAELARRLGLPKEKTHMLLFDAEMCRRVVAVMTADDFEDLS